MNQRLKDIENNGYHIDFGNIINDAFENYKKIALYAGLVIFVFGIIFALLLSVGLIATMGAQFIAEEMSPEKLKIENFSSTKILIINAITLLGACLFSPFQASFLKMAHYAKLDIEFKISDLFSYYAHPYLSKIIGSSFVIGAVGVMQANLLANLHLEFLGILINYSISFITLLTIPLIIFANLSILDAIRYSILIIAKHPITILGLVIVAIIGSMVGLIGCCIGILFTIPISFSINYTLYSSVVGFEEEEKEENQTLVH